VARKDNSSKMASTKRTAFEEAKNRAMTRAIIVAACIEVPLLAVVFYFLPVDVESAGTTQTYYSYQALQDYKSANAKVNPVLLGAEILTIAMIPLSAVAITLVRFRQ
jgi:hypothetical protein